MCFSITLSRLAIWQCRNIRILIDKNSKLQLCLWIFLLSGFFTLFVLRGQSSKTDFLWILLDSLIKKIRLQNIDTPRSNLFWHFQNRICHNWQFYVCKGSPSVQKSDDLIQFRNWISSRSDTTWLLWYFIVLYFLYCPNDRNISGPVGFWKKK